ncbi:MAG TPA: site-specific integrase [Mycobacterium sp.]|nr:site-specific integrase [Mycobacterium sp.]HUH71210.1 site-specific integrase [Mycobacterium sp.]
MARIPDYVKLVETARGKRYEVRIEVGDPAGKRRQQRRRFERLQDAIDAYAEERGDRARGTQITPTELTLQQACEQYLDALHVRANTRSAYTHVLRPAVTVLGDRPVQKITRADIERLVRGLQAGGVPSGQWRKPLKLRQAVATETEPWKATTIKPMLARLRAVYARLVLDGTVPRNIPALVKPPPAEKYAHTTLTVEQMRTLFASLESDRLEHLHHLALQAGLRRGELAGLRWENADLDSDAPTITIDTQRLHSADGAVEGAPKTAESVRVLPIPATLLPILKRARVRSWEEQLAAGTLWRGGGYVVHSEFGEPYYPTSLDGFWSRALRTAGLPHVRLHDARHTAGTLMHLNSVPIAVIAKLLGHTDPAFTQRTYAHSQDDAMVDAMATYAQVLAGKPKRGR